MIKIHLRQFQIFFFITFIFLEAKFLSQLTTIDNAVFLIAQKVINDENVLICGEGIPNNTACEAFASDGQVSIESQLT